LGLDDPFFKPVKRVLDRRDMIEFVSFNSRTCKGALSLFMLKDFETVEDYNIKNYRNYQ